MFMYLVPGPIMIVGPSSHPLHLPTPVEPCVLSRRMHQPHSIIQSPADLRNMWPNHLHLNLTKLWHIPALIPQNHCNRSLNHCRQRFQPIAGHFCNPCCRHWGKSLDHFEHYKKLCVAFSQKVIIMTPIVLYSIRKLVQCTFQLWQQRAANRNTHVVGPLEKWHRFRRLW